MPAKRVHFEMVLVAIEYCAHYPPHIVYPVGIEEAHRPLVHFRRQTAEHQYPCAIGQKGGERVFFYGHLHLLVSIKKGLYCIYLQK